MTEVKVRKEEEDAPFAGGRLATSRATASHFVTGSPRFALADWMSF